MNAKPNGWTPEPWIAAKSHNGFALRREQCGSVGFIADEMREVDAERAALVRLAGEVRAAWFEGENARIERAVNALAAEANRAGGGA